MILVLLTGEECGICDAAKAAFEKRFTKEIIRGEAKIINLDDNEAYQEKWMAAELEPAPVVLLETNDGEIISAIPPEELMNYKPPTEQAETPPAAPVENSPLTNTNPT